MLSISTSSHSYVAAARQVGVTREKRIQYARELLEKNFLPHVSISPGCQTLKVQQQQSCHRCIRSCGELRSKATLRLQVAPCDGTAVQLASQLQAL